MVSRSQTKKPHLLPTVHHLDGNGVFAGYASLFGVRDFANDKVATGAFLNSLQKRGARNIRMLFQHDPAQPIGTWEEIREDEKGLFVRGRLAQTGKGLEILQLMRQSALDGLSIGFKTLKSRRDRASGTRIILEADLWEISVVTFPMLDQARIRSVKNASDKIRKTLPTIREFEKWLTQDAEFTRSEARTIISKGFNQLKRKQDAASERSLTLATELRRAEGRITGRRKNDRVYCT